MTSNGPWKNKNKRTNRIKIFWSELLFPEAARNLTVHWTEFACYWKRSKQENAVQWNPVNTDTYGPKKAGRNNRVAVIRGHCGIIVNVQRTKATERALKATWTNLQEDPKKDTNSSKHWKPTYENRSYGIIVSMICNIQSICNTNYSIHRVCGRNAG